MRAVARAYNDLADTATRLASTISREEQGTIFATDPDQSRRDVA